MPTKHKLFTVDAGTSDAERAVRIDLAACYRLVAHYGWDDLIYTHISARVPGPEKHFLINPYGMMFAEITASSLIKVDLDGNKIGESPFPVNPAGFTIHSAVHMGREDAHCVIHLHTLDGVAVSAQEDGLLPLTQTALFTCPDVAYHEYEGAALDHAERARLQEDLGAKNKMILRNHGTLSVGRSVPEAFMNAYFLERSCSMQVRAQSAGARLHPVSQHAIATTAAQGGDSEMRRQSIHDLAWPALLRLLDRKDKGYRT